MKKYIVKLTDEERKELKQMIYTGKESARKLQHARILLKADKSGSEPSWSDEQISKVLEVSLSTVSRVRRRFVKEGIDAALSRREGTGIRDLKVDRECEAHLAALIHSAAPEGQARWTLRKLAQKMVELEYIESISYETVRKTLKKMS
jgi:transposase